MKLRIFQGIAMTLFAAFLSGCASEKIVTATVPFSIAQGNSITFNLDTTANKQNYIYTFGLNIHVNPKDKQEYQKLTHLFGGNGGHYPHSSEMVPVGTPIPLELKVTQLNNDKDDAVKYSKKTYQEPNSAYSELWLQKQIAEIMLPPGFYRVSLTTLEEVPELVDVPVALQIYVPNK